MRNLNLLDTYRRTDAEVRKYYGSIGDETCGVFLILSVIDRAPFVVVASSGDGWDHVSVSRANRCPNWPEMEQIKRLFFKDDETAMQLHVPVTDHLSRHAYCLHLWRPHNVEIPRPPAWMVDVKIELGI
jgi:hypothetical protein